MVSLHNVRQGSKLEDEHEFQRVIPSRVDETLRDETLLYWALGGALCLDLSFLHPVRPKLQYW